VTSNNRPKVLPWATCWCSQGVSGITQKLYESSESNVAYQCKWLVSFARESRAIILQQQLLVVVQDAVLCGAWKHVRVLAGHIVFAVLQIISSPSGAFQHLKCCVITSLVCLAIMWRCVQKMLVSEFNFFDNQPGDGYRTLPLI